MRRYIALLAVALAAAGVLPALAAVDTTADGSGIVQSPQPRLVLFESFHRPG